jgi:hypothetical protein
MVAAATAAVIVWIVLWAIGFGRVGDAFIIAVPTIVVLAAIVRNVVRGLSR